MRSTLRDFGSSLQITVAAGYVLWVMVPGHASTVGLGRWVLALTACALVGEAAWRRGNRTDLAAVARVTGLIMLVLAVGLFIAAFGIEAMVPALDF